MTDKKISNQEFLQKVKNAKVIPVLKFENTEDAMNTINALSAGGIQIAEITYRTEKASECIKMISQKFPDMLVGAGTITNVKKAKDAVLNGAKFIVMPGYDKKTVSWCIRKKIPVVPGVATPSEIMKAVNKGINVLKLFPAEVSGGIKLLRALKGPFYDVNFIPTGGITSENAKEYLALSNVIAVGGTWIAGEDAVKNKQWQLITQEAEKIRGI
ncbi:MAG: bifunctional 4-hydroxy-2-oxoglutarate aldolase/2-dehydro-3-deoxy-phosphogluconate aldolase [Spirochaetia bacterium]|nr:bifunctional 4-hydroxy-2-oxoglutarate aldolase/2-dehydro-3-deoxy-phosphogluconate aldolase [Spirochaetia bacterium]MDD7698796.1 bifunctional 4-hydroxy-2-oxoglutarate aldolase/2-dehydro-3-deoxy-phosphogluconate aldolase [Spirochaetia bacterium]MDY4210172.1 bifunctional 4-hydroxy-2-oxoglutarate aldolase/2-dehydro-3-deoxy-phosphogluconate aldolase [Treponema sp.]